MGPGSALGMESLEEVERAASPRGALRHAVAGFVSLVAGMVLGGLGDSDGLPRVLPVVAGFIALVALVRRALVLWKVDELLFAGPFRGPRLPTRSRQAARPRRSISGRRNALRLVGLAGISLLSSVAIPGQQTIFNVPAADILDVTLAADWYTGRSGPGYARPGLILTQGRWVLCASYMFKNGDSIRSGLLLEMGFTPWTAETCRTP